MGALPSLDSAVTELVSYAAYTLHEVLTIDQALAALRAEPARAEQASSHAIYFYVINDEGQLVGVLPVRHLILAPGSALIKDLMIRDIVALNPREKLFDALELFAMYRLLAIPVVDESKRFLGVIELSRYTEEVYDLAQNRQLNEVFQLIGLHLEQHKRGSPLMGFKLRMPWLLSNITGGLICAALGSIFEATLQRVVLIALFIPLILTLAESISVQSMTLAIEQAVSGKKLPSQVRIETLTALMLGVCSGIIVGAVSLFWRGPLAATFTIGGAVALAMVLAALLGRAVPRLIRVLKLNPRIASGPITLAIVDVVTVTVYLGGATMVLGGR